MKQINRGWGLKTGAQHKKDRAKPGKCRPQGGSPIREPSAAGRGWKRRNSHQSAVFAEGGNGTVVGISELSRVDKKDATSYLLSHNGFRYESPYLICRIL